MIEFSRHIEILLLNNDCVIVPNFGGFLTHYVGASYEEGENRFLPPSRTVGFNPQLQLNDHILVQSYIEAYDISYPEAMRRIENEVEEMKQHLENEGSFDLNGLGTLSLNEDGNYEFTPCEAGILTPTLYGLSSFEILPEDHTVHIAEKTEVEEVSIDDDVDNNIVISMSWMRSAVATAAVILLFLFISTPVDNSNMLSLRQQSSFLPVAKIKDTTDSIMAINNIKKTDSIVKAEQTLAAEETKAVEKKDVPTSSYTICLASQTLRRLAEPFLKNLQEENIADVRIVQMDNTDRVRVICGSFATETEARNQIRQYRSSHQAFEKAWVLHLKE